MGRGHAAQGDGDFGGRDQHRVLDVGRAGHVAEEVRHGPRDGGGHDRRFVDRQRSREGYLVCQIARPSLDYKSSTKIRAHPVAAPKAPAAVSESLLPILGLSMIQILSTRDKKCMAISVPTA